MRLTTRQRARRLRLVCTVCGFAWQPRRGFPRSLWAAIKGDEMPAKWPVECSNCPDVGRRSPVTTHFVDDAAPRPPSGNGGRA